MRPRDENKDIAIRETALHMIVEEGFKGMSMQKLAKQAGVSPATIYLYYEDREDLLNKLYLEVEERTNRAALVGFNPEMNFADGLRTLWLNRFRYFSQHPEDFFFINQFINSPLIHAVVDEGDKSYNQIMQQFYSRAKECGQIPDLPLEVYWPVAFSPLYQIIRFHLQKSTRPKPDIQFSEQKLLQALALVLKALEK